MSFFEGFFGKAKSPERAGQQEESMDTDVVAANDPIEYEQPDMTDIGPIINDAERPQFSERAEVPQVTEEAIAWEQPEVKESAPEVSTAVAEESLADAYKYDGGIDFVSTENTAVDATEGSAWDDPAARVPGDLRAQKKEGEYREAA